MFLFGAFGLSNMVLLTCPTWCQIFWVIRSKCYQCLLPFPPPTVPLVFRDFLAAVSDYPYGLTRCRIREQPPLAGNFDKVQRVTLMGFRSCYQAPCIASSPDRSFSVSRSSPFLRHRREEVGEQRDSSVWDISSGEGGWWINCRRALSPTPPTPPSPHPICVGG